MKNEDIFEHLNEDEVIVWKVDNDNDFEKIALEWADRCQNQYRLDICQFPYSCTTDSLDKSLYFRTFEVQQYNDTVYPKQTVTDLLPCAFYTYEISTNDRNFLYFNGSFVTNFSAEDFDLNLMNFSCKYLHPNLIFTLGLIQNQPK